jgi:two-component system, NtrC family, response regulator AtoC
MTTSGQSTRLLPLTAQWSETPALHLLIGESDVIRNARRFAAKVAKSDVNVLLTGDTGTGKECVAQTIHRQSARAHGPFMAVNCAALPDMLLESELFGFERGAFTGAQGAYDGKFRAAAGGTLLLDEVGEMSALAQAKILRAIETREVFPLGGRRPVPLDVRIIAATNQDLLLLVASGRFRKDLYYRLNVARIHLPPLRERKEDIPLLLQHFLTEMNTQNDRSVQGFTAQALARVMGYDWPGNVRELRNLLEVIFVDPPAEAIDVDDLPASFRSLADDREREIPNERDYLLSVLSATRWNKARAARELQWSRMTLYRKMSRYGIVDQMARGKSAESVTDSDGV